jgi:transcriptional regulator with XRE-family HTH domain
VTKPPDELAAFLRARRQALSPEDVGLPLGRRRRTPGLRREEVAQLADIGTAWYTVLEQGRQGRPSDAVLTRLAEALRLTATESRHLFALADRPPPDRDPPASGTVPDTIGLLLDAVMPNPAYVADRLWNILAWNGGAAALFGLDPAASARERNMLRRFFNRKARLGDPDWQTTARTMVASFRVEWARDPAQPALRELLDELLGQSAAFGQLWALHEVKEPMDGLKTIHHPLHGRTTYTLMPLRAPSLPGALIMIYFPARAP